MYWSHERCSNFWCNCVGGSSFTAIPTRGAILLGVQNYTRSRESDQGPQSKNLSGTKILCVSMTCTSLFN